MEIDSGMAEDLGSVVSSLEIRSATEFLCDGAAHTAEAPTTGTGRAAVTSLDGRIPLVTAMQTQIYQLFYCRRKAMGCRADKPTGARTLSSTELVRGLSIANKGKARWEDGWEILQAWPTGLVLGQRQGCKRLFWPQQYAFAGGGPGVGKSVRAYLSKEDCQLLPGYYVAMSDAPLREQEPWSFIRFYWNISPEAGGQLMEQATTLLNRYGIPYRFKCPMRPDEYTRADAAVLFVNKRFYPAAARLAAEVYRAVKDGLREQTPMFARRLAPGLALAEDPGNGESFGSHRSRLVAEGLWNSFAKGLTSGAERMDEVCRHLLANGSFPRTHLSPGSIDQYEMMEIGW